LLQIPRQARTCDTLATRRKRSTNYYHVLKDQNPQSLPWQGSVIRQYAAIPFVAVGIRTQPRAYETRATAALPYKQQQGDSNHDIRLEVRQLTN
jgi:hypothetical protein